MRPRGHTVQLYRDERGLIDTITTFIKVGLYLNETVLVLATAQHREKLATTLTGDQRRHDKLRVVDAAAFLRLIMGEDGPNEAQFMQGITTILGQAGETGQIRVFGELVAVLGAEGQAAAAMQLEVLWNILVTKLRFSLLCAYPLDAIADEGTRTRVIQLHQHAQIQ
jgi:hypothetical protein